MGPDSGINKGLSPFLVKPRGSMATKGIHPSPCNIEFHDRIFKQNKNPPHPAFGRMPFTNYFDEIFCNFSLFRDVHCPLLAIYSIWKHRTTSHVQRVPYPIRRTPRLVLHNLTHLHRFPRCLLFLLSLRGNAPRALPISSPTMSSLATQNYPHPTQCTKRLP